MLANAVDYTFPLPPGALPDPAPQEGQNPETAPTEDHQDLDVNETNRRFEFIISRSDALLDSHQKTRQTMFWRGVLLFIAFFAPLPINPTDIWSVVARLFVLIPAFTLIWPTKIYPPGLEPAKILSANKPYTLMLLEVIEAKDFAIQRNSLALSLDKYAFYLGVTALILSLYV
jgi:hypothetical protein